MKTPITDKLSSIPGLRPDISFQRDDAYTFLPRMIALVMTMVAFMLLLTVSLSTAITQTSNAQRDTILIHIPASDTQDDITASVLAELTTAEHVESAKVQRAEELMEQMQPWLGNIEHADELPVPTLIRVMLSTPYTDDIFETLKRRMADVDASVIVDAPAEWSANYRKFSNTLKWVLIGFSSALLLGLLGLMSFVATTAIKLHRRTVILLHSIGATDNYIAAQFQINSALLAIKGALIGCVVAGIVYVAVGVYVDSLNAAMLPELGPKLPHLYVIFLLPLIAAAVGFISGRLASLRYLQRLM